MKIRIDTAAFGPVKVGQALRSKSLTALIKLADRGHAISLCGEPLDDGRLSLLKQEEVGVVDFGAGEASISIATDRNDLLLTDHRRETTRKFSTWDDLLDVVLNASRHAEYTRTTRETDISVKLNIDGKGTSHISTGLGFFDHMLDQIAKHGYIDLDLQCKGDLHVDEHHTIEDVALALGQTLSEAAGDKRGAGRYGFVLPMDESLALVALDLSGRPLLEYNASFTRERVGDVPTEMVRHFFYSLAMSLKATLHIEVKGENDHHKIESMFKGLAKCLRQALDRNERYLNVLPSSKGKL
ncbi:MAG: imidazoleglycerol-phosphate dehydratase HisB [Balneolales bacterium]